MNRNLLVSNVIGFLTDSLGCSQKTLSNLLSVSENTISSNRTQNFSDIHKNKLGLRLKKLLFLVETLKKDPTLSPHMILKVLNHPGHETTEGGYLSAASALQEDSFNADYLWAIVKSSVEDLRREFNESKKLDSGSFYLKICSEEAEEITQSGYR